MESFLLYLGKVALAMGAFYLMFLALFQRQKHFRFNRLYLLASMGISYLIPLITFTVIKQVEAMPVQTFSEPVYSAVPSYTPVISENPYEWYHYLFVLLLIGAAGFFIHFIIGSLKAWNIIRKSYRKNELGQNICITRDDVHPFSFFNKVVISEKNLAHPNLDMILSHEKVHVKERHTFDILIAEILFLFEWLNPFAWLLKDAIKSNLEYLTDDFIVRENDREAYQLAMVSLADKQGVAPFLTALNGSQLKNRIIMMKKKTTNRFAVVRQLLILPLLAVLIMGLSNKEVKTEFITMPIQESSSAQGALLQKPEKTKNKKIIVRVRDELITLKGKITNQFGEPISDATIVDFDNNIKTTSDNKGNYSLEFNGISKPILLECTKADYYSNKFVFYGNKNVINIHLTPKENSDLKKVITGKVTDVNGKPIIGAMFIEYDVNGEVLQGCTTDIKGEFKFETKSGNSVIKCSAIGYKEKEISINEGEDLTVVLQKKPKTEDDYGNIKITGCVTDENGNKLSNVAVVIEGIWISTYTDETGNYEIRVKNNKDILLFKYPDMKGEKITVGDQRKINVTLKEDKTSLKTKINNIIEDDKKPLYVVDGKITKNIDDISPDDVNSVTVLKDEQAKELYGEKGEDGVIFIDVQTRNENQNKEENSSLNNGDEAWEVQNFNTGKIEWRIKDYEPKALIIVDGEEVSKPVEQIDPTSIENVNILKGEVAREVYGIKGENGVIEITTKNSDGAVYNVVDKIPQFPGGPNALHQFLQNNIKYPEIARDNGIQGRVLVTITINEDGKVSNPRILRGVDPSLDKEAIRVAGTLPYWKPGKVDGKPVKTNFSLPVEFKLPNHPQGSKTLTVRNSATGSANAPLYVIDGKVKGTRINNPDIDPEDIETLKVLKGERATEKYGDKAKNGAIEITTKEYVKNHPELKEKTDSETSSEVLSMEDLFFKGGKSPEFPGGESGLSNYVADKVNYPVIAQKNGIQGKVFVKFTIDKKGNVKNPYISKGVDPSLDKEALRVVHTFPKFEPGKLNGKPVEVLYTVPITFKLQ